MDDADAIAADEGTPLGSLYQQVVEAIGQAIVDGTLAVDDPLLADDLCVRYDVSRSVVREAVRTLGSMGLVRSRRHSGTRVRSREHWDLLNPHVVRWRARGRDYLLQMRQLLELRLGVEPAAAALAAHRMGDLHAHELLGCVDRMDVAFAAHDQQAFYEVDSAFHRRLLEGTGNAVIAQLADTIDVTLLARGEDHRPGMHAVTLASVARHRQVAEAILARDAAAAEHAARALVASTLAEFEAIEDEPGAIPQLRWRPLSAASS